jgi:hypothetical protein
MGKDYKGVLVNKTNIMKLHKGLEAKIDDIANHIIEQLVYIGEACVKIAREKGNYGDRTGNLRSSIGYVVLKDGSPIMGGKPAGVTVATGKRTVKLSDGTIRTIKVGGNGAQGVAAAETLMSSLKSKYPRGIVLIVCAGMRYAAYVENIHHKDVLTSADLLAESLVKQLLYGIVENKK